MGVDRLPGGGERGPHRDQPREPCAIGGAVVDEKPKRRGDAGLLPGRRSTAAGAAAARPPVAGGLLVCPAPA
ncbi:hypothetical protein ACWCQ1_30025 [Streptomyces sp. NPDC002144]|uniref:hypothetical protein n=1 Tax=Streptomyces sp. NPDC006668 TaxID=3156903 RepID=UPI0010550D6B